MFDALRGKLQQLYWSRESTYDRIFILEKLFLQWTVEEWLDWLILNLDDHVYALKKKDRYLLKKIGGLLT